MIEKWKEPTKNNSALQPLTEALQRWRSGNNFSLDNRQINLTPSDNTSSRYNYCEGQVPDTILCQWLYWSSRPPYNNLSDPKRLKTYLDYLEWLGSRQAKRIFYFQVDEQLLLQSFAWMAIGKTLRDETGLIVNPGHEYTLCYNASSAVRVYSQRHQGTGTELKKVIIADSQTRFGRNLTGYWVSTDKANIASVTMNKKLGFQESGKSSSNSSTVYLTRPRQ